VQAGNCVHLFFRSARRNDSLSKSRRNNKPRNIAHPTIQVDTLLVAKYGILQPTTDGEGMTIFLPIDDPRDIIEFAEFMLSPDRAHDFDGLFAETDEDEGLRDEL